jgi:hypothetical protein
MTDAEDFVAAARFLRSGSAQAAMLRLCPLGLTEDELASRVDRLIRVGAEMVAPLDREGVARLLAAGVRRPVDVLVDLVDLFAQRDPGRGESGL